MVDVLVVLAMLAICFVSLIIITTLMTKRAMGQVIRIMRYVGALDEASAKTTTEMGLDPPKLRERMMRMRDYKPKALNFLLEYKIVRRTEDGRIYLSERNLMSSALVKRWPALGAK